MEWTDQDYLSMGEYAGKFCTDCTMLFGNLKWEEKDVAVFAEFYKKCFVQNSQEVIQHYIYDILHCTLNDPLLRVPNKYFPVESLRRWRLEKSK